MKNIRTILSIFVAIVTTNISSAQNKRNIERANELYGNYAYVEATKIYEKIASQGYVNQDILQKLGNSYFFRADYLNALKWYDELFSKIDTGEYNQVAPEYYYRYAQSLKSAERYERSNEIMQKFVDLTDDNNEIAMLFEKNKNYLEEIERNSGRVNIKNSELNTEYSEYAPAFLSSDKIVYTANTSPSLFGKVSEWTDASMFDIYIADRVNDTLFKSGKLASSINTSLNESSATFSSDGKFMYFTRNNPYSYRDDNVKAKNYILKIYRAESDGNGKWINIQKLNFSDDAHSDAHPALSPDGKYLYFASNMPGSLGDSDIYRVSIGDDGMPFGVPENLGTNVNTNGRDTFPYVSADNILYFASDGYPGLGGLDIFAAKILENNKLGHVQNVGRPINSPYDDFSLVFDSTSKIGYFSSNRPGGKGADDIYSFKENSPIMLRCSKIVKGIVKDSISGEVLALSEVVLSDKLFNERAKINSSSDGEFEFDRELVYCDESYSYIKASKEGYETKEDKISLVTNASEVYHEILLVPTKQIIQEGTDLAKVFNIKEIYFDFDKSNIRPDAEVQLSKIVQVMKEHPNMVIEVKSHTDSRGSDSYNLRLSDKRAKSTVQWIISKGISPDRISGKGYGEQELVNGCSNGVKCTQAQHQANRRSEFVIVRMK